MTTYPLLQAQVGIYHAWRADPSSVAYNLPAVVPFPRSIDLNRLEQALQHIWEHRPELHTRITLTSDEEPRQWADPDMRLSIVRHTLTEKDAQSYINCGFVRPFDVLRGESLVRFELIETETHHYLLCDFHHLICDGMTLSQAFLNSDLPDAFCGKPLTPHPYGLYQHAEAEQQAMNSEQYQQAKLHYQQHFQHIHFTSLSKTTSQPWGERLNASLTLNACDINTWCQEQHITPNLLFMAAFSIVLSRLSGNQQVAYVTLHHGRSDRRLSHAYGMFVTSIPIIAEVDESQSIPHFFHQLRSSMMRTIRHQTYPLTHLCRDLHLTPSITFAFQGSHIVEETTIKGKTIYGYQPVQGTTKNDLSCMVYTTKDLHYEIRTEASSQRWSQQRLETFAKAVAACTQSLMAHPEGSLADLSIITPEQEASLLKLGQGEHLDYDPTQTIVSLFLQQAERTPDALAVTDGTTSLTYQELNQRSAAHAQHLLQQGTQAGDRVIIDTGQCTAFLIEALAAMRIGAAYVPLDAEWPESHKQEVMSDIRQAEKTPGIAYVIYTSGTTGKPKGVMISHRALLNLIHSIVHLFHLTAQSRISCHSSFAFDASVEDLFPVLTVGGSVHIMPDHIRRDPAQIHQFLLSHHITGGCYTTHLGIYLAEHLDLPMDYLCLGGERLATYPHTHPKVFNTYGPTEFTVDATYYEIPSIPSPLPSPCKGEGDHAVYSQTTATSNGVLPLTGGVKEGMPPIGRPLPNLTAYVTDTHGHLLPLGEVGELRLSGIQKANNYTQEPYPTGDLVRWNNEGQLEYIGRKDRQLKLHGYRIEPEEIETRLLQLHGIRQAAVLTEEQTPTQLTAYYTADHPLSTTQLTAHLSQTLPPYMVPHHFHHLQEMPLTTAGKPDYAALSTLQKQNATFEPPANQQEHIWCTLFEEVLNIHPVSVTDNFFHLGGTSILVASLQAEALQHGIHLSYGDVFQHPTPRQLAAIQSEGTEGKEQEDTLQTSEQHIPLTPYPLPLAPKSSSPLAPRSSKTGGLLLTGATGYLGSHLLRQLLTTTTTPIYCLVRANNQQHAIQRLLHTLGTPTLPPHIIPIVGDLHTAIFEEQGARGKEQEDTLQTSLQNIPLVPCSSPLAPSTVIHCAADTRHFAADGAIERTNIDGTDRIIDLCLACNATLIHISTLSVATDSTNPYIRSKAIAEQHIQEAITHRGLRATILRIGNLATPSGDPQGTLADTLKALQILGQYPQSITSIPIHLTSVDLVAQQIIRHMQEPEGAGSQPINCQLSTVNCQLSDLLQKYGNPSPISDATFQATLNQALTDPNLHAALVPLLHYQAMAKTISPCKIQ